MHCDIETAGFSRQEAAEIVGISDGQLANWLSRYKVLGDRQRGSGHHLTFILRDLFQLAAMKLLVDAGIEPAKAADALRPYASPYSALLHNTGQRARYPGTTFLTLNNEGRWVGADGPDKPLALEIRAWPIWDVIFPRMREIKLGNVLAKDLLAWKLSFDDFDGKIEKLRRQRWSADAE